MGNSCDGKSKDNDQINIKKRKEKKTKKSKKAKGKAIGYDEGSITKGETEQGLIDFITSYANEEARDVWEELGEYKAKQNVNKGISSRTVTTDSNGRRYLGTWDLAADKKQGFGVYVDVDGSIFEGYFKDDVRNGKGRHISSQGIVNQGKWVNNKFQGSYRVGQLGGSSKQADDTNNSTPTGEKMFTMQEGGSWIGGTKDKKKHGIGVENFTNGDSYTGGY